ncbi:MAG TPA: hypothetical protein ACFYD1_03570, partial [Candidatus Hypogeohydataceae bacterium YC38]
SMRGETFHHAKWRLRSKRAIPKPAYRSPEVRFLRISPLGGGLGYLRKLLFMLVVYRQSKE